MFTMLFSTASAGDADLQRLARTWLTGLPAAVAPVYWDALARELPLDKELMHRYFPPPGVTQTSSGRPYAMVSTAPRPWRSPRVSAYNPRRLDTLIKRVADPRQRPVLIGLHLGAIDIEDVPVSGGDLNIQFDASEDDPALVTYSLYRQNPSGGVTTFPDSVIDGCVSYLKDLCRAEDLDFAGVGDFFYMRTHTFLDKTLWRTRDESIREARRCLRGYAWITMVPPELAVRLGGADALSATGAFHEVEALPHGGVWLRATESLDAYDAAAVRRVFRALAPVLPPGLPEITERSDFDWQIVEEDAAAYR